MKAPSGRAWLVFSGILVFVLAGCAAGLAQRPSPVAAPTATAPALIQTPAPPVADTTRPAPARSATAAPAPQTPAPSTPTPTGGGSGDLIFQSNFDVYTGRYLDRPLQIAFQACGSAQPGGLIFTQSGIDGMDWSPDGKHLVFSTRNFLGVSQLFVIDVGAQGISGLANVQQLYTGLEGGVDPAWSPSGNQIAFVSGSAAASRLCVMNADGKDIRCLVEHFGQIQRPDWSPDEKSIAFSANRFGTFHIYLVTLDGAAPLRLTDALAAADSPQYSPAGDWIVYQTNLDGNDEIYKIRPDRSGNTRLTDDPAADFTPAWSPDGQWISFFRQLPTGRSTTLCTLRADGSDLACRADFPSGFNLYPRWRPEITTLFRLRHPLVDGSGPGTRVASCSFSHPSPPDD